MASVACPAGPSKSCARCMWFLQQQGFIFTFGSMTRTMTVVYVVWGSQGHLWTTTQSRVSWWQGRTLTLHPYVYVDGMVTYICMHFHISFKHIISLLLFQTLWMLFVFLSALLILDYSFCFKPQLPFFPFPFHSICTSISPCLDLLSSSSDHGPFLFSWLWGSLPIMYLHLKIQSQDLQINEAI